MLVLPRMLVLVAMRCAPPSAVCAFASPIVRAADAGGTVRVTAQAARSPADGVALAAGPLRARASRAIIAHPPLRGGRPLRRRIPMSPSWRPSPGGASTQGARRSRALREHRRRRLPAPPRAVSSRAALPRPSFAPNAFTLTRSGAPWASAASTRYR